jgi:predicted CoA-binding protein
MFLQTQNTYISLEILVRLPYELNDIKHVLQNSKTVAVLGAHYEVSKAAYYVPRYLQSRGYHIFPVNAIYVNKEILGKLTLATLTELSTPIDLVNVFRRIDLVNVFRRSEAIPEHLEGHLKYETST